jgi:hypothetical protein
MVETVRKSTHLGMPWRLGQCAHRGVNLVGQNATLGPSPVWPRVTVPTSSRFYPLAWQSLGGFLQFGSQNQAKSLPEKVLTSIRRRNPL